MKKIKIGNIIMTLLVLGCTLVAIYPLIWMFLQSLKSEVDFFERPFGLPSVIEFSNFVDAWIHAKFSVYYKNSIIVTFTSVFLIVLACSLNGYALSKIKFKGRKIVMGLIVSVLFLPGSMLLFPVYMISRQLGTIGTFGGLLGPYVAGAIPIGTLLMYSAFSDVPDELMESARIDGCGHFRIYWKIMMPLVKSAISTVCIIQGMAVWNEFLWALMSLSRKEKYTLPVGLHDLADQVFRFGYGTIFAGMVMTTLPIVLAYAIVQKQFVKAVTSGAVKG